MRWRLSVSAVRLSTQVRSLPVRLKLSDRMTGSLRRSDHPSMAHMNRRPSLRQPKSPERVVVVPQGLALQVRRQGTDPQHAGAIPPSCPARGPQQLPGS